MRSSQLSLTQYDSDKLGFLEWYDSVLEPWLEKDIVLLELGVNKGGSLLLWRDYFPRGSIVGIDIHPPRDFHPPDRVHVFEGNQADKACLSRVADQMAPGGIDIVIDDASHVGELTKTSFWHLFDNHLKPGGLYVIEDWGTGYWEDWPDGKSLGLELRPSSRSGRRSVWSRVKRKIGLKIPMHCHSYGMVGFVKQLIDEQGASDVSRKHTKGTTTRSSKFEQMIVAPSIVFIKKAGGKSDPAVAI